MRGFLKICLPALLMGFAWPVMGQVIPFSFVQKRVPEIKRVTFTMASTPSSFTVSPTYFRYDKEFAWSQRFDDGWKDAYITAFRLFEGGDVVSLEQIDASYPGLYYTDGCGNDLPFKGAIAINTAFIETATNPTSRMNYNQIMEIYVAGWGIWNHSHDDTVLAGTLPVGEPQRTDSIRQNILLASRAARDSFGIKLRDFTAPSNDDVYDPLTTAWAANDSLRLVNNIKAPQRTGYGSTADYAETWFDSPGAVPGVGAAYDFDDVQESSLSRAASDLDFMDAQLALKSSTHHPWFTVGVHRVDYEEAATVPGSTLKYLSFKDFYERLENTYGKDGADNMWFAPQSDVYEYREAVKNTTYTISIDGNQVTVTFNFAGVDPEFRIHALSFVADSDQEITGISYEGFSESSHNISTYGADNTEALVNIAYRPKYEAAVVQRGDVEVKVSALEATQAQADSTTAQTAVNNLPRGPFRDGMQARINAVPIVPSSQIYQVDFGRSISGYTLAFPWNNMLDTDGLSPGGASISGMTSTTSETSSIGMEIVTAFDANETNVPFNSSEPSIPFPYEAARDGFETPNTSGSAGQSQIKLTGLDPAKVYDLLFFGSRGSVHDETLYTATGSTTDSALLFVKNNVSDTAQITGMAPDGSNEILITVEGNGNYRGYINVLQITERNP